jgi:hypothetical protein
MAVGFIEARSTTTLMAEAVRFRISSTEACSVSGLGEGASDDTDVVHVDVPLVSRVKPPAGTKVSLAMRGMGSSLCEQIITNYSRYLGFIARS